MAGGKPVTFLQRERRACLVHREHLRLPSAVSHHLEQQGAVGVGVVVRGDDLALAGVYAPVMASTVNRDVVSSRQPFIDRHLVETAMAVKKPPSATDFENPARRRRAIIWVRPSPSSRDVPWPNIRAICRGASVAKIAFGEIPFPVCSSLSKIFDTLVQYGARAWGQCAAAPAPFGLTHWASCGRVCPLISKSPVPCAPQTPH
jgi:hypothetical protein